MSSALANVQAEDFMDALERRIQESIDSNDYGWDTIASRGPASATFTGGQRTPRWYSTKPQINDRDEGRYYPFYTEERDLDEMRAKARHLGTFTSVAIGAMQALSVYTIGGEWEYKFAGKKDQPEQQPSKELLAELNAILAATLERNQWIGELDHELHDHSREDGDLAVAGYKAADGLCDFRRLDADQVKQPANEQKLNNWLDCSHKNSWTFGVHTIWDERMRRIDHERAIGLHVCFDDGGKEWDYLPAWPQPHGDETLVDKFGHLIKRNTPRKAKRGVTDYWPVQTDIERESKLSENLAVGAAVLAGIPWFEDYPKGTTRDQAEGAMARGLDQWSRAAALNRVTADGGTRTVQHRLPGTIVKALKGVERTMGPLGQVRQPIYIEVCQHLLRAVGRRWLMPEYMISGDASNANYSSTLVSESPFVKAREADQRFYVAHFRAILWKAIKIAFDHGRFSKFANLSFAGIVGLCELQIQPPMVASRDKTAQLAELQQLWEAGLLKGNEYRIDLKREPKPEWEEKTYSPPMLPGQLENGLAAIGGQQPPPGGQPAKPEPKPDKPSGGGETPPQPKPGGDRKEQLRAEAFSRAIESAQSLGEARAIAGKFRLGLEGRWVTLNGSGAKGGAKVYIDDGGEVQAGPPALKGKDLDDKPAGPKKSPKPGMEPAPAGRKKSTGLKAGADGKTAATQLVPSEGAGEKLAPQYDSHLESLPNDEKKALQSYVTTGYKRMNGDLRKGGEATPKVAAMDRVIDSAPRVPVDLVVSRGVANGAFLGKLKAGDVFQDHGFMSTEVGESMALGFTSLPGKKVEPSILHIKVKKGSKALFYGPGMQDELILPRGSKLRVLSVGEKDANGKSLRYIQAELVQ